MGESLSKFFIRKVRGVWRVFVHEPRDGRKLRHLNSCDTKVQFGCGPYQPSGWINCDLFPQHSDIYCVDVRKPLPFADGSVSFIFCEHLIEHLTKQGWN